MTCDLARRTTDKPIKRGQATFPWRREIIRYLTADQNCEARIEQSAWHKGLSKKDSGQYAVGSKCGTTDYRTTRRKKDSGQQVVGSKLKGGHSPFPTGSVLGRLLLHQKANLSSFPIRRSHQLSNRVKDHPELSIVFLLECIELASQALMG